jgi:hypothetical protein
VSKVSLKLPLQGFEEKHLVYDIEIRGLPNRRCCGTRIIDLKVIFLKEQLPYRSLGSGKSGPRYRAIRKGWSPHFCGWVGVQQISDTSG